MQITFNDLAGMGYESVTDYCRQLIKDGVDDETLYVYRGDMLCLTVDILGASKLRISDYKWKSYYERKTKAI